MTDDLYERYKEALRVGHVAVLRGALAEAIEAYKTAASIAPSRALPHTSLGGVLLRLGHLEEALVEYAAAVARAPHDEGALLGQAEALTMAGQRVDAAQALDHVSEIQEAAGRLPEAADTLRRALELEDAPDRARHQRGLLREIRLSAGDQAAEQLLARALRLRDEPSGAATESSQGPTGAMPFAPYGSRPAAVSSASSMPDATEDLVLGTTAVAERAPEREPAPVAVAEPDPVAEPWPAAEPEPVALVEPPARPMTVGRRVEPAWPESDFRAAAARQDARNAETATAADRTPAATSDRAQPATHVELREAAESPAPVPAAGNLTPSEGAIPAVIEPILAAVGVMDGVIDTEIPLGPVGETQHQPTGDELLAAAEAADLAGDYTTLRSLLLWTARAYAREGRFEAGLDATHRLLQRAPGDVDAHLVLVELYVARDWNSLAAEKLVLLGRLAELNNDEPTRQRLCAVASRVFPNDERLGALCA